jgi:membrane protein DedA with SNARE-associated domain
MDNSKKLRYSLNIIAILALIWCLLLFLSRRAAGMLPEWLNTVLPDPHSMLNVLLTVLGIVVSLLALKWGDILKVRSQQAGQEENDA